MRRPVVLFLLLALGAVSPAAALAAPGDLDRRFGDNGTVRTNLSSRSDWAHGMAVQPNGRIVVVGGTQGRGSDGRFAVLRYNPGGRLDRTFSGDGVARVNFADDWDSAEDVAIQADGKIVVVGSTVGVDTSFAVVRFDPDGTLDTTFGDNGKVTTDFLPPGNPGDVEEAYARSVAIQDDGKIVVAGSTEYPFEGDSQDFALARYNPDGTLDSSFDGDGKVTTNVSDNVDNDYAADVAIQADGKIVAAGGARPGFSGSPMFGVARYNADGTLDSTFDGDGKVITAFVNASPAAAVALQTDGKIVVAGRTGSKGGRFALIRYETDGAVDATFGGDGRTAKDFTASRDRATDVVIQPSGKILAVGIAGRGDARFALARFYPDGGHDTDFGHNGKVMTNFSAREDSAEAVAIQSPARVVVAGQADRGRDSWIALARYRAPG
ncbi:MAG: delta-60 repeat domain-containing protein [Gaiellaceae bacterium]